MHKLAFTTILIILTCVNYPNVRAQDTNAIELRDLDDEISRITEATSPWAIPHTFLFPSLHFGHAKSERLVNLRSGQRASFTRTKKNDPMALITNRRWNLGGGIRLKAPIYPLPLIQLAAAGIRSQSYTLIKRFASQKAALTFRQLLGQLHFQSSHIHALKRDEKIHFVAQGAFLMRAQFKVGPVLSLGPMFAFESTSSVRLLKVANDTLEIRLIFDKAKRLAAQARTPIFETSIAKFKSQAQHMTFHLDLRDKFSEEIIKDLLIGDLRSIQEHEMFRTRALDIMSLRHSGTRRHTRYGIPIIAYRKNNSVNKEIKFAQNDYAFQSSSYSEVSGKLTTYSKKYQSAYVRIHKDSATRELTIQSRMDTLFEKERLSSQEFLRQLNELERLFQVTLPRPEMGLGPKSYSQLRLSLHLSAATLNALLNSKTVEKMGEDALEKLQDDFRRQGHRAFCRFYSYYNCIERFENFILSKTNELERLQKEILISYNRGLIRPTSRKISQFVKALFSSDYLISSFMELDTSSSSKLYFHYTGKDFRALRCLLDLSTKEFSCLNRSIINEL